MDKQKTKLQISAKPLLKLIKRLLLITFRNKIHLSSKHLSSLLKRFPLETLAHSKYTLYNVVKFLLYVMVCTSNPNFEQLGPKMDPQPNFLKRLTEKLNLFTKSGFNFFNCSKKLCVHLFWQRKYNKL